MTPYLNLKLIFCLVLLFSNGLSAYMLPLPYLDMAIPAGLLIYPLALLINGQVIERFGSMQARQMVRLGLFVNIISLCGVETLLCLSLPDNIQGPLRLSAWRIFASITAYLAAQLTAIHSHVWIKRHAGQVLQLGQAPLSLWISQCIDTLVIDLLFLYGGLQMNLAQIWPIMLFSYGYKMAFSCLLMRLNLKEQTS